MPANFPDYLDAIGTIAPASHEQVRAEFEALEGSYRFQVRDERQRANNPPKFVTLRVDCENGLLSGDLFHDAAGKRWLLSWRSDAIYSLEDSRPRDQRFVALCATFFPKAERQHPFAKLLMSAHVRTGDEGLAVPELRLAVIDGKNKLYDLAKSLGDPVDHTPALRRIRLYVDVEPALEAEPFGQVIDRVIGRSGADGELSRTMKRERLLGDVIRRPATKARGGGDDPVAQITAMLSDHPDRDALDNDSFLMILSAAEDDEEDILGRTIGIDALPQRFGSRRAAVVFPKEILQSFRRQRGRDPAGADDLAEFAYRLKFTILHELGHLLNLPHCWQRDGFADVRLTAEPAEATWMQYGSLFPLGSAHDFALQRLETKDERRSKRDTLAAANFQPAQPPARPGGLLNASFTRQEQRHLFHAPHDQICAGGRTFIDAERQVLAMQAPGEREPPLELTIDGARRDGDLTTVTLQNYVNLRADACFQPPTGKVRFRQREANGDGEIATDLPFRFSSDALLWLFREEFETMWTNAAPRREMVYEPELTLLSPAMLHPRRNLGGVAGEDATGRYVDFVAPLPLLQPGFLFRSFSPAAHFTTQVAYLSPGGRLRFSNQIRISFERNEDTRPFGAATSAIEQLLSDEALPALGETALYFARRPLDGLAGVAEMKQVLLSEPVRRAIEDQRETGWLRWLERLVTFVETRRFVEEHRAGSRPEAPPVSWNWAPTGSDAELFLASQVEELGPARELFRRVQSTK